MKYGDLEEPEGKRKVAYTLMKELGAQWHVGHHAFEISVAKKDFDSWQDSGFDEKRPHDAQPPGHASLGADPISRGLLSRRSLVWARAWVMLGA